MNTLSKHLNLLLSLGIITLLTTACVSVPTSSQRHSIASQLATSHHWQAKQITTLQFDLVSYQPKQYDKNKLLTVYIEGDGLAWLTKSTASTDPTPINPVGLKLALNHPQGNAVYLARPCQYSGGITARNCNKHHWTDSRFSGDVIESTNQALNILKAEFEAEQLQLVGYSGGGAIATLLAARRNDVIKLITVAGNLDHQAWTTHHHISPLSNSLNPINYRQQLAHIEQIHFVGANDKVIPPFLAEQFTANFSDNTQSKVVVVPDQKHGCCWSKVWGELLLGP